MQFIDNQIVGFDWWGFVRFWGFVDVFDAKTGKKGDFLRGEN
jgi:hypothetical protein